MLPAAELKVMVGVFGMEEANKKLVKFDATLQALASSDPTVTLHAEVDRTGFEEFAIYKNIAEESITTTLQAEVDDAGFEAFGVKKMIAEEGITSTLHADVDDLGFEEFALKKHIASEDVTAELHADATGFATVVAQLDAMRALASTPIVQEVKLQIDKSSLAVLGAEEAAVAAVNGNGNGHSNGNGNGNGRVGAFLGGLLGGSNGNGHGILPSVLWGNHSPGGAGPWWMRALMGGGMLAGAGSLGSFAGFGAEHFLFTGLGLAGSAGAGLLGGGLIGAGALGQMAVGSGSDMAVMKSTIGDVQELGKKYDALQEAIKLYGAHSKQAAVASAQLHLAMREMGPAAKSELAIAKQGEALDSFWNHQTQNARIQATKILSQVLGLGHDYVPLVAHAAEQNLAIVDHSLKPLFSWLEGPQGTGIFKHLEAEFAQNLPTAMHAFTQGTEFVIKTVNVASEYTGGFIHKVDEFFTKWNEPQNFSRWEGEINHLVGDFHMWMKLLKEGGRDIYDLFSQDAHTGAAIVVTLTEMLHHLGEWERSVSGKHELHDLFVIHREEIIQLLHVIPPLIGAIEPIYMTVAPFATEAMTEVLGVVAEFLKMLDETGPVTRWALGLTLIASKLLGVKTVFGGLWKVLKGDSLTSLFAGQATAEERVAAATEQMAVSADAAAVANERLAASMEAIAAAGGIEGVASMTSMEAIAAAGGIEGVASGALAGSTTSATTAEIGVGAGAGAAQTEAAAAATVGSAATRLLASPYAKAGAVAAGYFLAEFGAKLIAPGTLEGQNLEESLFHGFNTKEVARTEARALADAFSKEVNHALAHGGDIGALRSASHNRARTITHEQTEAMRAEAGVLDTLKSGLITRMGDIRQLAHEGSTAAAAAFGENPSQWRKASADNMLAVVNSIKAGEQAGLISAQEGQKEIAHAMREYHLLTGDDPFHIASAFTQSWKEAGSVNEGGISHALAELQKMPPISQAIAEQTMLHQVRAFERGGQLAKGTFSRLRSAIVTQLQLTREHGGAQVEHFTKELNGSFGSLSVGAAEAFENIGGNLGALLSKLGAHNPLQNFTLHYLHGHGAPAGSGKEYLNEVPPLHRQSGGFTIPGNTEGDRHPMLLPYGSFIMNREATAAYGLQSGGSVPVLGESGERVFLPHEVAAHGAGRLEWMNSSVPRFQHGGMLGPEPHLQGQQGALLTLGQTAIHDAFAAAQHFLGAHQSHGTGGINYVSGGGGPVAAQIAHVLFANGFNRIGAAGVLGNAWRESHWNPASVGTGGGGLFGFTTPPISLADLQAAAKRANVPWTDVAFQVEFMLRHGGAGMASRVNSASSPGEAARIFMEDWEHPGVAALEEREAAARKAFAMGFQSGGVVGTETLGGLIEREEHNLGVPNSKAASKATPTHAVQWEMSHLGQSEPWNSENPGEWCGDFQAAAMRAIGLTPPAGYSAAAAWANYGTPLGKSNMQAGAIIDYGHQHVAMALDSSKMISGNWGGTVATSAIESAVEGTPITAVRWPPYGHGPGAGSTPTETVPGVFDSAHTHSLSFPSIPKNLKGVEREIHHWRAQLAIYKHALADAQEKKRPKTAQALQKNVTAIEKHLRELERARATLRAKAARTHYSRSLAKQLGKITGREKDIELAQRAYQKASQYAEQVVGLEPREPAKGESEVDYLHRYEAYVEGKERPVYMRVLETEASWRNTILGAEATATSMEGGWEGQIRSKMAEIASIEHYSQETEKHLHDYRRKYPKGKLPDWLKAELANRKDLLERVPTLRFQERELRKVLGEGRQEFYGGYESTTHGHSKAPSWLQAAVKDQAIQPPVPPLAGTGSLEQSLQEVQGIHWPEQHERLTSLPGIPIPGSFGGAIWDTQTSIEELGLKIQQAAGSLAGGGTGSSQSNTEREHLLEELLTQAHQREAIGEIERQTLHGVHLMPYAGAYESGGPVAALVGENGPEIIETRPGAYIRNASETSSVLSPKVAVHFYEGERRAEVEINGKLVELVETTVHKMDRQGSRGARRGLARPGV